MDVSSIFSSEIMSAVGEFAPILILVGVFFFGEVVVLSSFILAAQGFVSIPVVFVAALLGTLLADFFWFFMGRYVSIVRNSKMCRAVKVVYDKQKEFFLSHPAVVLLVINFMYGFRWSTIVYYASTSMTLRRYVLLDTLGSAVYVIILGVVGVVTGRGLYNLVEIYHSITLIVLAIVVGVVLTLVIKSVGQLIFKHFIQRP